MYVADPGTVTNISYTDWATVTGPVTHTVTVLVTEAVLVCVYISSIYTCHSYIGPTANRQPGLMYHPFTYTHHRAGMGT